ncbi:dead end protein 1 [Polymixia lowei]
MDSRSSRVLNLERLKSLDTWLKETNVKLTQVNGQRKYGGPPEGWQGPNPGSGCEVFISQIPRDVYEDQLIPLFSSVGPLWEFRLMMNFSGQNRGFAYAKYGASTLATAAIRLMHGHILEPGVHLSVRRSTEKRHLCLGELPLSTRREELLQVLRDLTEGVQGVSLKTGPGIEGVSALVVYSSHHAASMAKKVLVEDFKRRFALNVSVKWQSLAKPKNEEPAASQKTPKSHRPAKPPRHNPDGPRALLPPPVPPAVLPLGFSRAVGGPTTQLPPAQSPSSQVPLVTMDVESPMFLLHEVCRAYWGGQPLYELKYSHGGSDGFLYFNYKVRMPGLTVPFTGQVTTLPGPTAAATLDEAHRAAAKKVLQSLQALTR